MKETCLIILLVVSSSGIILKIDENAEYEGKVSEAITEETAYSLCREMNLHLDSLLAVSEIFYNVSLLQTEDNEVILWLKNKRMTAIKTLTYFPGCYRWEMRPCYGYYPYSFHHPCTFWIPKEYPGGKCKSDFVGKEAAESVAQKPVTINGRSAAQLCLSVSQAQDNKTFSISFIPLKLNLRSTNRCDTWSYTPNENDTVDGKWDVEDIPDDECDEKYPDHDIEEVGEPNLAGARCFPNLGGEYECFFGDNNIPNEVLIDLPQLIPTATPAIAKPATTNSPIHTEAPTDVELTTFDSIYIDFMPSLTTEMPATTDSPIHTEAPTDVKLTTFDSIYIDFMPSLTTEIPATTKATKHNNMRILIDFE